MQYPSVWTLEVIGPPRLVGPAGPRRIDRRTATLLTYVAIEGPQPRSRLAGLLWPETRDATARANLRQLLHRLREAAGTDLVGSTDPLELTDALAVDVRTLRESARTGNHAALARYDGALLDGVILDDAPELAEWLDKARDDIDRTRRDSALADSTRLEHAGDLAAAIVAAQRAVDLDPVSEAAHRQLMKTHYLAGDRAAASAAYARCRTVLRERLGVEPSIMTNKLADEIARSRRGIAAATTAHRIPVTVLRPPVLAGREREWAAMERAWASGQAIVIGGPPGIGKSRLMTEFLTTQGRPIICTGRPGDHAVPYGTHARTYREVVQTIGRDALPPWVARELARLIPELGEMPGPLTSAEEKLRFWNAKIEVHRIAYRHGYNAFGLDDLQYVDHASAEAGAYILDQLRTDPSTPIRTVHSYRTGELPEQTVEILRATASAGLLLHLELEPLSSDAVSTMLGSLGIPGVDALSGEIVRYAGGSPMFILETVRHLIETDTLATGRPTGLLPTGRAAAVLAARIERLSPRALELARLLAVLGTEFSLARAGEALDISDTELVPFWEELVDAQIVRGDSFSHDLLAEAVLAGMPAAVRQLLHRRAAEALDVDAGSSARIAAHWIDAGEPDRASDRHRQAILESRSTLLQDEAQRYFQRRLSER